MRRFHAVVAEVFTGDELEVEHVGYSQVLVGRVVTTGLRNMRSSLHSGNKMLLKGRFTWMGNIPNIPLVFHKQM